LKESMEYGIDMSEINELKRIWENDQIEAEFVRTFEKGKLIPDCPNLIPYKEEEEKSDISGLQAQAN